MCMYIVYSLHDMKRAAQVVKNHCWATNFI